MKALFIVEQDFLTAHVGVRRVIIHYIEELERAGYTVDLGSPKDGHVYIMRVADTPASSASGPKVALAWTTQRIRRKDYETIVISNPWLCARKLQDLPGCIGIVYDVVPNLIASGVLRFSNAGKVYGFAREHDIGFRYYLKNARRIVCISESTRKDFLELYGPVRKDLSVITNIPFAVKAESTAVPDTKTVLLVNALDARKNLKNLSAILERAHARVPLHVVVMGNERAPMSQILEFFERLIAAGIPHQWFPDADDAQLDAQYRAAAVLLFPSLYEGLGLPVLEAQDYGVPAVTTNISSLPEINMNADLCFAADDVDGMACAVSEVLANTRPVLRGDALRQALAQRLARHNAPVAAFH